MSSNGRVTLFFDEEETDYEEDIKEVVEQLKEEGKIKDYNEERNYVNIL